MAETIVGDIIKISRTGRPELKAAVADDGGSQTDETTEANESTADDVTLLPAAPATGDAYYFGGYYQFGTLTLNVSTAGAGTWSLTWEYWDGAAWSALSNVTDGTSDFQTAGANDVTYDVPTDWETTTVNSEEAYYVRARVSSFTDITTQPLGQEADVTCERDLIAMTRGEVSLSPNTNVAESSVHASIQQLKEATSEAWEVSFEKLLQSTLGGLETAGLTDSTETPQTVKGYGEAFPDGPDSIEVDIEQEDGTTQQTWLIVDSLLVMDDATIGEDDFSTVSLTVHSRQRPRKIA